MHSIVLETSRSSWQAAAISLNWCDICLQSVAARPDFLQAGGQCRNRHRRANKKKRPRRALFFIGLGGEGGIDSKTTQTPYKSMS
jgi:hypothetical protein